MCMYVRCQEGQTTVSKQSDVKQHDWDRVACCLPEAPRLLFTSRANLQSSRRPFALLSVHGGTTSALNGLKQSQAEIATARKL